MFKIDTTGATSKAKSFCFHHLFCFFFIWYVVRYINFICGSTYINSICGSTLTAGAVAAAAAATVTVTLNFAAQANAALFDKLKMDLQAIEGHAIFKDIAQLSAAAVKTKKPGPEGPKKEEGEGFQAGFDQKAYETALSGKNKKYKCAANFFHHDMLYSPTPGIPYSAARINLLVKYYFTAPAPFPLDLIVAVPDLTYAPMTHRGAWKTCNPEEMRMAFVFALAQAIRDKDTTEETLQEWRHVALTCTSEFRLLESDEEVYITASNIREKVLSEIRIAKYNKHDQTNQHNNIVVLSKTDASTDSGCD